MLIHAVVLVAVATGHQRRTRRRCQRAATPCPKVMSYPARGRTCRSSSLSIFLEGFASVTGSALASATYQPTPKTHSNAVIAIRAAIHFHVVLVVRIAVAAPQAGQWRCTVNCRGDGCSRCVFLAHRSVRLWLLLATGSAVSFVVRPQAGIAAAFQQFARMPHRTIGARARCRYSVSHAPNRPPRPTPTP